MGARETAIGYVPQAEDIDLTDLHYTIEEGRQFDRDVLRQILDVEDAYWQEDCKSIRAFYEKLGDRLPAELRQCLDALERRVCHSAEVAD